MGGIPYRPHHGPNCDLLFRDWNDKVARGQSHRRPNPNYSAPMCWVDDGAAHVRANCREGQALVSSDSAAARTSG